MPGLIPRCIKPGCARLLSVKSLYDHTGGLAMSDDQRNQDGISLASTLVAVTLLFVIGAVLSIGAARYDEGDLAKLIGALGPLLGIVTGAFVTYFFTRQAVAHAQTAAGAQAATEVAQSAAQHATTRAEGLRKAITEIFAELPPDQARQMKGIPSVGSVLEG